MPPSEAQNYIFSPTLLTSTLVFSGQFTSTWTTIALSSSSIPRFNGLSIDPRKKGGAVMCEVGEKDCRGVCTNDGLLFKSHDYNSYSFHNSRVVQYTVIIYINIYFQIRFSREARATLPNQQVYPQICFQRYHYRCHELEPSLSRK